MSTNDGMGQVRARERRTGRPSLEQAEEIDRIIFETATTLYLREGPTLTMKAIVEESGLSSKTVYARYPNRDALLLDVLRSLLREAKPPLVLDIAEDSDIFETLGAFVLSAIKNTYQPEAMALQRMLTLDPNLGRQLGPDIFRTVDRILMDPLSAYLAHLRAAQRIREVDTQRTARALTTQILAEAAAQYSDGRPPPSEADMEDRAFFIADLFYHSLKLSS